MDTKEINSDQKLAIYGTENPATYGPTFALAVDPDSMIGTVHIQVGRKNADEETFMGQGDVALKPQEARRLAVELLEYAEKVDTYGQAR